MTARAFRHLLILLGFVLGQWLAVAHATQHELTASAGKVETCSICTLGHGDGNVGGVASLPNTIDLHDAPLPLAALPALPPLRAARANSRGPPSLRSCL